MCTKERIETKLDWIEPTKVILIFLVAVFVSLNIMATKLTNGESHPKIEPSSTLSKMDAYRPLKNLNPWEIKSILASRLG